MFVGTPPIHPHIYDNGFIWLSILDKKGFIIRLDSYINYSFDMIEYIIDAFKLQKEMKAF